MKWIFLFFMVSQLPSYAQLGSSIWLNGNSNQTMGMQSMVRFFHGPQFPQGNSDSIVVPEYDLFGTNWFSSGTATLTWGDSLLLFTNGCKYYLGNSEVLPGSEALYQTSGSDYGCEQGWHALPGCFLVISNSLVYHLYLDFGQKKVLMNRLAIDTTTLEVEVLSYGELIYESPYVIEPPNPIRHGNGRDWWIHTSWPTNTAYNGYEIMVHLTEDGVPTPLPIQNVPISMVSFLKTVVSPDGQWFVRSSPKRNVHLFHVDRCSGLFTYLDSIKVIDGPLLGTGIAFSPNSKWLYISSYDSVWRYNVDYILEDIDATKQFIGTHDGDWSEYGTGTGFDTVIFRNSFGWMKPGANGKIYIPQGYCDSKFMHVINDPDNDENPDFQFKGVEFQHRSGCHLPQVVEYHFFDAPGSPCDTLGIDGGTGVWEPLPVNLSEAYAMRHLSVYPNPTQDAIKLSGDGLYGSLDISVYNAAGQQVYNSVIQSSDRTISLGHLPPGFYQGIAINAQGERLGFKVVVVKE
jgi:Secretion system C-terminal sorting domain/WD40-like Beta Propeller Repeat